ncbi:MAG: HAD family hydrolase [Gammaproteobacteria bacterium]|uniref:HAD family hydrolase n=1 Tax=Candidatus Thiopontia autotrophica TaxID=2841688 RepID=A0A8J6TSW2_9GAMM|nr:HAD family hydrolase [Candidatus Thiopontia autotrophica]MBL6968896.1 HAD family hydrolase [Gammaproteobacteria bacterium]
MKAIIFDVDGTLADTERDGHRVAFNLAFADAGLDWVWSEEMYGRLLAVTGGKERIRHYIELEEPEYPTVDDLSAWIASLHASKTEHFVSLLQAGEIPLRSGVRRLLTEAHEAGVTLAIATTTTPQNVSALLEHAMFPGAESWFKIIGAGDIVPNKKPSSDIYDYVLAELGLSAAECIAIEDSHNGLSSSLEAGLTTIVTVNGYTEAEDFTGAALVLDQMGESNDHCHVLQGDREKKTVLDLEWVKSVWSR